MVLELPGKQEVGSRADKEREVYPQGYCWFSGLRMRWLLRCIVSIEEKGLLILLKLRVTDILALSEQSSSVVLKISVSDACRKEKCR